MTPAHLQHNTSAPDACLGYVGELHTGKAVSAAADRMLYNVCHIVVAEMLNCVTSDIMLSMLVSCMTEVDAVQDSAACSSASRIAGQQFCFIPLSKAKI